MKTIVAIILIIISFNISQGQTTKSVEEAKGLAIGEMAPNFSALNANNETIILKEALQYGPVVLVFYRGFWCPVCNTHLATLQDSLQMIEATEASIIAISPEKPEYLEKMSEKSGAQFTLLYDENYRIATAFDVNYKPKSSQLMTYNIALGAKIKKSHSSDAQNLPIPATFIINKDGEIIWRQFDPNYKSRSSVKEIIENLQKL
ncbi:MULTISPECIES: peroxiredoxin-like family protein [unclassified Lentimicrobium]|uniref:peroxiredoxin-like family protein n=1 Tax=unclassified Lentimicrobium TaxID=2677434 RepID=UPI00155282BC|nr:MULTISPECIES: redoxin domain-containing protein [unclassified Lentimicrobium]NPD44115.1 redoxin domain-containing protein [Lentimicrobium sp. S6]NPD86672.1 redoxin domain-containing protein [Lentimicrobium sp. L6]